MSYFKKLVKEVAAQVTERGLTEFWMGQVEEDGAAFISHYKDNKFVAKDTIYLNDDGKWEPLRNPNGSSAYDYMDIIKENPREAKADGIVNKKFAKQVMAQGYFYSLAQGAR